MNVGPGNVHGFVTTRWTQVVAAQGKSPEAYCALRELCAAYYAPVEWFIRRYRGTDDVRDVTQEFFARILEGAGQSLRGVDKTRGRFRSYLLGAVRHFLADWDDRNRALRRGSACQIYSLNGSNATEGADPAEAVGDARAFPSDAFFDRHWALAVVEAAIEILRAQAKEAGELARFEILKPWLMAPAGHEIAADAARSLGLSQGAFKVGVHRLRRRFRELVESRITATVEDPAEVAIELNYLIAALTSTEGAQAEE
jgi:DNA-directed RNA polymerase specialized sigma24 family protein